MIALIPRPAVLTRGTLQCSPCTGPGIAGTLQGLAWRSSGKEVRAVEDKEPFHWCLSDYSMLVRPCSLRLRR